MTRSCAGLAATLLLLLPAAALSAPRLSISKARSSALAWELRVAEKVEGTSDGEFRRLESRAGSCVRVGRSVVDCRTRSSFRSAGRTYICRSKARVRRLDGGRITVNRRGVQVCQAS